MILLVLLLIFTLQGRSQQDSSAVYTIRKIEITGNKKTKDRIILRELTKGLNDTLTLKNFSELKKRSEFNIFNTQLFIYDTIYPAFDHENKQVDLKIAVKERWYVWPMPVFEVQDRNFNTWWLTKDLFRINYGLALGFDNFTGGKDKLILLFQRGYTEKYGFSYRMPYINKQQTLGFNMLYVYTRNNEVTYKTIQNEPAFTRQYKNYLKTEHEAKLGLIHRPDLYQQRTLELVVRNAAVNDTVVELNPEYFGSGINNVTYASLQYRYTFDMRDNKVYPLTGWAFDMWIIQDGFDLSAESPVNLSYVTANVRKHTKLGDRVYMANLVKGRLMNAGNVSFHFNRALGWSDQIRGYEYYVMDGQRYVMSRNSLRFQVLKPRVYENKARMVIKQFSTVPYYAFINVFADIGYVDDKYYYRNNPLTNSWQYGGGVGLDFVTFYDIVLRFEYTVNKLGESGFFLHMTSGF